MYDIVYFSSASENTKRFVEKLSSELDLLRIPLRWDPDAPLLTEKEYVLVLPTYGGGEYEKAVPRQVVKFLNLKQNRDLIRGVIGTGNTNFGEHYCLAADVVAAKTGVPLLQRVEILGTPDDVEKVNERLKQLWITSTATTN
jgi:protein involved in ribonucleotide reduction